MSEDTFLVHGGRNPLLQEGAVNPPVYHASTIIYPDAKALRHGAATPLEGFRYGRFGTPLSFALEEAVAELEGGYKAVSVPSGLAAITATLLSFAEAGDHILVSDSVYFPTRKFCDQTLKNFGVETEYYDPWLGAGIKERIRPNTRLIYVEAPGSLTFEIQDIPAIAKEAKSQNVLVVMDNTWATPLFFKPFSHGVDVSIQAATKYIVGHADAMLGLITAKDEATWLKIKKKVMELGLCAGSEECFLGLRGLRTLGVRLRQHQENALRLAQWLESQPQVLKVLHPALPSCPGHEIWQRDFLGSSGLFGIILKTEDPGTIDKVLNKIKPFSLGYSWGGFESLAIPLDPGICRAASQWEAGGLGIRLHVGLEDLTDLKQALGRGLKELG